MSSDAQEDLAAGVAANLPYLRRYARALTGNQDAGDRYAAATLEAILADRSALSDYSPRVDLFRAFHAVWASAGGMMSEQPDSRVAGRAQKRMEALTANTREALLLRSVEGFSINAVGKIMQVSSEEELLAHHQKALELGLRSHLIRDSGRTEFGGVPTLTACAIGPDESVKIDAVTGNLKLY